VIPESPPYRDYTEIAPNLLVGSFPWKADPFETGASAVVDLAFRPSVERAPRDRIYVHWPIEDGPIPPEGVMRALCSLLAEWLSRDLVVLVHCDAGMNRSALIAARVLMAQGMDAEEVIARMRAARPGCLSEWYADHLRSIDIG